MKLRNKKTGEIVEFAKGNFISSKDYGFIVYKDDNRGIKYNSLAELNEEWEDYEDPEEYWYLENNGEAVKTTYEGNLYEEKMQEVGNYFSSREEAEKAVEKLKAWKRLKDAGFVFEGWKIVANDKPKIYFNVYRKNSDDVVPDLDLLFGGEE